MLAVTLFLREIVQNTDTSNSSFCLSRKLSNQIKNRYSDVLCLDHSRVQLCQLDGDDEVIIYRNIIRHVHFLFPCFDVVHVRLKTDHDWMKTRETCKDENRLAALIDQSNRKCGHLCYEALLEGQFLKKASSLRRLTVFVHRRQITSMAASWTGTTGVTPTLQLRVSNCWH